MNLKVLGYAVCHQLPERTFHFNSLTMPLCARCSGVYLGFIVSIVALLLMAGEKKRGCRLPQTRYIVILLLFMLCMGIDVFAQHLGLYSRSNSLSLASGLLMGVALANFILPVFNFTFWQRNDTIPLLDGKRLIWLLIIIAIVFFSFINIENLLFWPLSVLSIAGVFALYLYINSMVYLIVFKKENQGNTTKDLLFLSFIGFLMSIAELFGLATLKNQTGSFIR